jgi:predicted Rossmann fold nucleotide-binding protein DprA/Smf involved in DNA uptake
VHTAKCALKEGRPVLVTQWPGGHAAGGNRELLADGAAALQPGDDVVAAFESLFEG